MYIGRDGRDVMWSMHNHHFNASPLFYEVLNETPGLVGPPIEPPPADVRRYFLDWFERDGFPFWPFWEHVRGWWAIRDLPNVMLIHFTDLKRDMPGTMRRIARFLDAEVDPADWPEIETLCSFEWMKANPDTAVPLGGALWEGGGATFINKGTNGRWQSVLTVEDCAAYEARAVAELGEDCAAWMMQR